MRGEVSPQAGLFSYISPYRRVPADHPLRSIKAYADQALQAISGDLDALYGSTGRPSIAPERLLKGQLLIALFSVRSDRAPRSSAATRSCAGPWTTQSFATRGRPGPEQTSPCGSRRASSRPGPAWSTRDRRPPGACRLPGRGRSRRDRRGRVRYLLRGAADLAARGSQ